MLKDIPNAPLRHFLYVFAAGAYNCRYLETLKPLLSPEDYTRTEQLVQSLIADEGPVLQNYLQTRYISCCIVHCFCLYCVIFVKE